MTRGELMRKIRKPTAPPIKIEEDLRKYSRAHERQRLRRGNNWRSAPPEKVHPDD
jgi:hypothetical protein